MNVGMIGLGNMGFPIALRLAKVPNAVVYGFDVVEATLEKFAASGGIPVSAPQELLECCEVVFMSLPSNELIRDSFALALEKCKSGTVVVDTSSSVPEIIKSFSPQATARGIDLIDCPVSGGVIGAENGTLSAMCGGKEDAVAKVLPLLHTFATKVTHMGPLGSGYAAKLINNLIVGGEITLIAEALGLARKAGMDLLHLKEAISDGAAGSPILELKAPKMIAGDYSASSRVLIHLKDQHNAQQMAKTLGAEIPACNLSTSLLEKLVDMGRGNEDIASVIDLF